MEAAEKVSAFKKKLFLWNKRVRNENFAMFLLLDSKIGDQETNKWLTALINDHISNLEKKKIIFQQLILLQHGFGSLFIAEMNGNEQLNLYEQHLEFQSFQAAKTKFSSSSLIEF